MKKLKFVDFFKEWKEIKRKILLTFLILNQNHVIKDYVNK